jgi:hypothetical protein
MRRLAIRILRALLSRIDPEIDRDTMPPEPTGWDQRELMACTDMPAVESVLERWRAEGVPDEMAAMARRFEIERRVWGDARVNSGGGSA